LATMNAVPRRPHVTVSLRLPPELHARVTDALERERRSLTQQVIYLLEQWLVEDERERRRLAEERREHRAAEAPADEPEEDGGDPRPVGPG
jgi:hypothetical protein